jgi:radical SAM protein with 4Fe4S-binding SPASM domain
MMPNVIFGGCHLGQTCCILPDGDVMACRHMEQSVIGNLFREHLHEILTGRRCAVYFEVRNIRKCRDCELLFFCRGCRAAGVNMTGDLQAEDPCCWKEEERRNI